MLHVYSINYWISINAKIPSTEQDGGINVMSMGRNGSSLVWMTNTLCLWEEMGLVWPGLLLHVFTCTLDKVLDFDNRENSLHRTTWRN